MDELYWFVSRKSKRETRENTYVITAVTRSPRQIVGFDVAYNNSAKTIQNIIDNAPYAENYATDGHNAYLDVVFPGKHIRNIQNKNDTFTVEGVNSDLRHLSTEAAKRRIAIFCFGLFVSNAVGHSDPKLPIDKAHFLIYNIPYPYGEVLKWPKRRPC